VPKSKMRGAIPPFLQYIFMAWCLVKHRDNFTFYFTFMSLPRDCWQVDFIKWLVDIKQAT